MLFVHNLIRRDKSIEPPELELDGDFQSQSELEGDPIISIETSDEWSAWRDNLEIQKSRGTRN